MNTLRSFVAPRTTEVPLLEFRCYSFKELASIYYPRCNARQASRGLRQLIHSDPLLLSELSERGYRRTLRILPPAQVALLIHHLGTPEEFYNLQQS